MADNPALCAALQSGQPVIPVYIFDPVDEALGAAPKWRLAQAIKHYRETLRIAGSDLVLRRGDALTELVSLAKETGATTVHWARYLTPTSIARDTDVKSGLKAEGICAESHAGLVLFEPWSVKTGSGGPYKVYSPFWRSVRGRDVPPPLAVPDTLAPPPIWPRSDDLSEWGMEARMHRGAAVVARHAHVGEEAARNRLFEFLSNSVDDYKAKRDRMDLPYTSGLSENLAWGEISPRSIWHAALPLRDTGAHGAEHFLKELVWREFAWHLCWHTPHMLTENWRPEWESFPWSGPSDRATAWQQGQTGQPLVDAGMRELYVTGRMHNRVRMIVASYLTKHLMTDWRVGADWFADTLIDWDPASNAMGWQWTAGCGPDAAPYFRVFNPETQAQKFDPDGKYVDHWLSGEGAAEFAEAAPESWEIARPQSPLTSLKAGRENALAAYAAFKS